MKLIVLKQIKKPKELRKENNFLKKNFKKFFKINNNKYYYYNKYN